MKNNENLFEEIKQKWDGTVTACTDQEITVELEDLTNPDNPREIVVLSKEEVGKRDLPLVKIGALFFWHIGYREGPSYPRERFSKISFRRLPKWTEGEIGEAKALAKEYANGSYRNNEYRIIRQFLMYEQDND